MIDINQWLKDNQLVEHDLIQGSPEWDSFRLEHDGASESPVMLGISELASRTELLDVKVTGIAKEFSEFVRTRILDNGHRVEALARPVIEQQFGIKLYPVVYSRGRPSASCDGITMAGTIGWEHKQWNSKLAEAVAAGELPDKYMAQPQQCLLLTSADKWIFTVSDGTEENMVSMEIFPDPAWFKRILNGWAQFNKDRETHVPKVIAEMPKAEVEINLPALFVHAKGVITEHNMDAFGLALAEKLAEVRAIAYVTDQDFSNAKAGAKKFRETAKAIVLAKEQMLANTETIGEAARKMDAWAKDLNETALLVEKDVKENDLSKKRAMVLEATQEFAEHVSALEVETKPIRLNIDCPNFAEEIKGKSKYASMQNAVDTALANGKVDADATAKDIRAKLSWCKEHAAGMSFLFPDLAQIITKPLDDFTLLIQSRIKEHKEAEARKESELRAKVEAEAAAKLEAERAAMQAQEEAKAQAKAKAEQDAVIAKAQAEERVKVEAEQRAKAEAKAKVAIAETPAAEAIEERPKVRWPFPSPNEIEESRKNAQLEDSARAKIVPPVVRPADGRIIEAVQQHFNISYDMACDYIVAVAESLRVAA